MKKKTRKVLMLGGAVAGAYLLSRHLSGKSLLGGLGSDDPYLDALDAMAAATTPAEEAAANAAAISTLEANQKRTADNIAMANANSAANAPVVGSGDRYLDAADAMAAAKTATEEAAARAALQQAVEAARQKAAGGGVVVGPQWSAPVVSPVVANSNFKTLVKVAAVAAGLGLVYFLLRRKGAAPAPVIPAGQDV